MIFSIRIFWRWYSSARLLDASLITIAMIEEQCSHYQKRKNRIKKQWIKFSNRKDISSIKRVNICCRHFADNLQKKGLKRTKLLYECKPVPTIIPVTRQKKNLPPNAIYETIKTPRKPTRQKMVLLSFKLSKKGLFSFNIMYFLLYNPNLKSAFCGRTYKCVFFFMFFWFVWLG